MVILVHEKLVIRWIYLFHDIKLDQYMEFPEISYNRVINLAEIVNRIESRRDLPTGTVR